MSEMNYIEYVKANPKLAQMKESTRYPGLFVLKYSRKVFYHNLWDDHLVELRGRVVDVCGKTVINPFTKIFNRHENGTDIHRDEKVLAMCKVNGFMAAATYVPEYGETIISTTGSLDSDFATLAEKYLNRIKEDVAGLYLHFGNKCTWLFEIVDESDPHIIKEIPGAYLLGRRAIDDNETYTTDELEERYLDSIAKNMGVKRPAWFTCKFGALVEMAKECTNEGFVVYGKEKSLKIKTPFYLISKFLGRMRGEKFDVLANDRDRFRATVKDEEFFPLVDHIITNKEDFVKMNEQEKIEFVQQFLMSNV